MNILGIDYGKKRIGLAWVQSGLDVVLPFGVVKEQRTRSKEQILIELIKKEKVEKIIVGLPLDLEGAESENVGAVKSFVAELKKDLSIPIEFVDERFTTAEAKRMGEEGVSVDERAAMLILQSYLDKI